MQLETYIFNLNNFCKFLLEFILFKHHIFMLLLKSLQRLNTMILLFTMGLQPLLLMVLPCNLHAAFHFSPQFLSKTTANYLVQASELQTKHQYWNVSLVELAFTKHLWLHVFILYGLIVFEMEKWCSVVKMHQNKLFSRERQWRIYAGNKNTMSHTSIRSL